MSINKSLYNKKKKKMKIINNFSFYKCINFKSQQKLSKSIHCVLLKGIMSIKVVRDKCIFDEDYSV